MIKIDLEQGIVSVEKDGRTREYKLDTPEAFKIVSEAWLRAGWDNKYVYSFTWLGRPIIQLPEDMIRLQEVIHAVQPDVIVETGVAHGGALVFYASFQNSNSRSPGGLIPRRRARNNHAPFRARRNFDRRGDTDLTDDKADFS